MDHARAARSDRDVRQPDASRPVRRALGRTALGFATLLLLAVAAAGCTKVERRVLDRPSCEVCHSPLNHKGKPEGIEEAHPWKALACVDCHGGDPTSLIKDEAHPKPSQAPFLAKTYLKNLKSAELDQVDPAWLRFVNPGDLRVADKSCGDAGCHGETVDRVRRSMMAHTSGEITVARYRAGAQKDPYGHLGAMALVDPDPDLGLPTTVTAIGRFDPKPLTDKATFGDYQDHYMIKSCFRCHVNDFGENKFQADYRSSGCTACHMVYADDGLSASKDPTVNRDAPPHPIKHQLTSAVPTNQCMHCHYRGARIGPSYLGFRESGGNGFNPPNPGVLGKAIHGHDATYYVEDEDTTNDHDETPPDIHAEKGLHCIDCHTRHDVHGDGHLYSDTLNHIEIRCEDCHGDHKRETSLMTSQNRKLDHLWRDAEGKVWLRGKIDGKVHPVSQVKRLIDPKSPDYRPAAAHAMGPDAKGFNHLDKLECYTCHSDWMPSCYGCHVTLDLSREAPALTTGQLTPGKPSGKRRHVSVNDLTLMWGVRGKITPSMPAERFFLTVLGKDGKTKLLDNAPRMGAGGVQGASGMGARAVNPHTTRSYGRFSVCSRCHLKQDQSNRKAVEATWGFGSDRYLFTDGAGKTWRQDQLMTKDYKPLVTPGHDDPEKSRPLDKATVERLKQILLP